ncbi:MAG: hypothetical protein HZB29_04990 [Nitrospinae bacterium]|nr:hypothetical protein [Nitrospinota bacterium]
MNELNQQGPGATAPKSNAGRNILIGVIIAVVALGWIATVVVKKLFSYGVEKAVEISSGVSVDKEGGTLTFKGKDGTSVVVTGQGGDGSVSMKGADGKGEFAFNAGNNATLPADFPKDFPVIAGAKITASSRMSQGKATVFNVVWEAAKDIKQAGDYYTGELTEKGWKFTMSTDTDDASAKAIERQRGNNRQDGTLALKKKDTGSEIVLILRIESK